MLLFEFALGRRVRDWDAFYWERIDRNLGWITLKEQRDLLRTARVGIAGCGGMGGLLASILVRLGVGTVVIADNDVFDVSNLNRQFGAALRTVGLSKAKVTARMLRRIAGNSVTVIVHDTGVSESTVEEFVSCCNVICDEIEFWAVGSRIMLHQAARKHGVTIFNSPTVGHRVYVFRYEPQSMHVETLLEMDYKAARLLEERIQKRIATKEEVSIVMKLMLRLAAPDIPEYSVDAKAYSTVGELKRRLFQETRASIIATNPPMATGFLANHILFFLLKRSDIERNFVEVPPMPGYLMFDAGHFTCEQSHTQWW